MLSRVALAVALVCAGSICSCVTADLMSRLVFPRDNGVKLCGREFIRAVIFTCGGSRWRRSPQFGEFVTSALLFASGSCCRGYTFLQNLCTNRIESLVLQPINVPAPSAGSLPWTLNSDEHGWSPAAQLSLGAPPHSASSLEELLAVYRPHKKKRNFSLGVAGKCCTQGCTKNDIGRLC